MTNKRLLSIRCGGRYLQVVSAGGGYESRMFLIKQVHMIVHEEEYTGLMGGGGAFISI